MKGWLRRAGRPFLLVAGLAFAGFLVWHVGTEKVADVLRLAGIWLPVVALLEMGFVATDIVGLRVLLGPANVQKISRTSWVLPSRRARASKQPRRISSWSPSTGRSCRTRWPGCRTLEAAL